MSDFDKADYDTKADFNFEESGVGDRRQEIVFIGTKVPHASIKGALDQCLLSTEEMKQYKSCVNKKQISDLKSLFENKISPDAVKY